VRAGSLEPARILASGPDGGGTRLAPSLGRGAPEPRGRESVARSRWRMATRILYVAALLAVLLDPARAPGEPTAFRSFDITASRFQYEPARLEVSEGDLVRLTLRSTDTTHGFGIKELKVEAVIPRGGEPVTVEFVADQPGTFEFFCTEYCGA